MTKDSKPAEAGRLLTIEEVGEILQGKFAEFTEISELSLR
jgi:hypothetical protein